MIEYSNSQIAYVIDEYIHNSLHRDILKSRFIDGLTYEAIAETYDRSVRNIKNIIKKIDELVETVQVLNPRLYASFIRKLDKK